MNNLAQAVLSTVRFAEGVACARGVTSALTLSTKKTTTKTTFGV